VLRLTRLFVSQTDNKPLGRADTASEEDTVLIFPRNFAPLPLSHRPYGTLSLSAPSAAA